MSSPIIPSNAIFQDEVKATNYIFLASSCLSCICELLVIRS
ncbi:uncharacterized protein METZ01_LOCUS227683, partial [marine metagenome]